MGVEFELKFSAEPAQQEAIQKQYLSTYEQFRMQTTYYDTPSGALSARHITLRCRMENEEAVCTVKTPWMAMAGASGTAAAMIFLRLCRC